MFKNSDSRRRMLLILAMVLCVIGYGVARAMKKEDQVVDALLRIYKYKKLDDGSLLFEKGSPNPFHAMAIAENSEPYWPEIRVIPPAEIGAEDISGVHSAVLFTPSAGN